MSIIKAQQRHDDGPELTYSNACRNFWPSALATSKSDLYSYNVTLTDNTACSN
jgi:hypothetical protein